MKSINKEIKIGLRNQATIKSIETIAIKLAIENAIEMGLDKIIILTDSKASCSSLNKVNKERKFKYYENEIIKKVLGKESIKIIIQWIPGHMGIAGNEKADALAKAALENPDRIIDNLITREDAHYLIEEEIRKEWIIQYNNWTTVVGKYNKQINETPPRKPWFAKTQLSAYEIRQLNRLRSGHAKSKKFLNMVGIEDNNICEVCNVVEDNQHIVENCKKYDIVRQKYNTINRSNLIEILKSEDQGKYKSLCEFLKEINCNL